MTIEVIFKPTEATTEQLEAEERFGEILRRMMAEQAERNRKELELVNSKLANNLA